MFYLESAAMVSKHYYTRVGLYLYIFYVNMLLISFKKLTVMDQGIASIVSVVLKIRINKLKHTTVKRTAKIPTLVEALPAEIKLLTFKMLNA